MISNPTKDIDSITFHDRHERRKKEVRKEEKSRAIREKIGD